MKYLSNTRIPHHANSCHTTYMKCKLHYKSYANLKKKDRLETSPSDKFCSMSKGHLYDFICCLKRCMCTDPGCTWLNKFSSDLQRRTLSHSVKVCIVCTHLTIFTVRTVPPLSCQYEATPQPHWGKHKGDHCIDKVNYISSWILCIPNIWLNWPCQQRCFSVDAQERSCQRP